ncbi:GTPase HflX [Paucilactobacillus kaifaensis]|uniref:GTPase HflX n=1 Tax=Paucilactobacillus kaifaensis TaxID=2559921 RepID=UPI0010F7EA3B|nr:GTPase HflX [Paucilactobacillus kaifaensis]
MDNTQETQPVIIAGLNNNQANFDYSMDELKNLVTANHMTAIDTMIQNLERPNPATYFGKGKVEELAQLAAAQSVAIVVVNDELTPSQIRNLEEQTKIQIMDRTALILEIFAQRAQTKEAKLQVEIAQLQYRLPRLRTSVNQRLDQQTGAGGGSFTNRGAGETKLEMNRRTIKNSISHLRAELAEIDKSAITRRAQRDKNDIPTAALVGYTNAGKSTIMNGLIKMFGVADDKQVFEKDMLFATLDTSVRQLTLPDNKQFLLSDTVGFVSQLPTHLVEAFKSTLAEASQADLLIQVIDYSDSHYKEMMQTTADTLAEIGIKDIPMINVFNKADKLTIDFPALEGDDQIVLSAQDPKSLKMLVDLIRQHLFKDYVTADLLIPFADGDVVSFLNDQANIMKTEYLEDGTKLTVELSKVDLQRFKKYVI